MKAPLNVAVFCIFIAALVAGCVGMHDRGAVTDKTKPPTPPADFGRLYFTSIFDPSPKERMWYEERVGCPFVGDQKTADIPAAVYGIASASLTYWARTKLPDPQTECWFSPARDGFNVIILSHTKLTLEQFKLTKDAIQRMFAKALREYRKKAPLPRDLPDNSGSPVTSIP